MEATEKTLLMLLRESVEASPIEVIDTVPPQYRVLIDGYVRKTKAQPIRLSVKYATRGQRRAKTAVAAIIGIGIVALGAFKAGLFG